MNNYTDSQLKQALAKMLPDKLVFISNREIDDQLHYLEDSFVCSNVLDTELLHLCWLVEDGFSNQQILDYEDAIANYIEDETRLLPTAYRFLHATWQQRVIALAKVKGVEI